MPTDGIQRRSFFRGDSYEHPDGEWVRFSDVQARLQADAERIRELEAQTENARRLLVELEQSVESGAGLIPAPILESRLTAIFAALAAYREDRP